MGVGTCVTRADTETTSPRVEERDTSFISDLNPKENEADEIKKTDRDNFMFLYPKCCTHSRKVVSPPPMGYHDTNLENTLQIPVPGHRPNQLDTSNASLQTFVAAMEDDGFTDVEDDVAEETAANKQDIVDGLGNLTSLLRNGGDGPSHSGWIPRRPQPRSRDVSILSGSYGGSEYSDDDATPSGPVLKSSLVKAVAGSPMCTPKSRPSSNSPVARRNLDREAKRFSTVAGSYNDNTMTSKQSDTPSLPAGSVITASNQ
eukprot:jgi/Bigna1/129649/aug1.9_g4357